MSEASDRVRPGGPTRLKSLASIAAAALLAALLPVLVALWVADGARKLITGESATVRSVTQCVEGGPQLPASHCYGTWAFADGRTASGKISGAEVSAGDTIFAGAGWAYDSTSPLHRQVWVPVTVFGAGAAVLAVSWLNHRRNQGRSAPDRDG
ncbi:hypothetical protein ACFVH0_23485 [Streptomyces sp. NPDC127117]|uniref:hypothetical protein n=1 Tax=Streptomyces sp. NPDC127117 TaxID=3345368 RepID=UPI00364013C3